ncbi:MAG TPA: glycosyl hydrolase [Ignavibacteriales bacterium]|nr:glycosyl hydrolase [Ignavibacteriales bacterium]
MIYYFGGAGGGIWKTTNGGETWKNISDGFFGGSIGAIAVSEWDPNVIFVGGGEGTVRGNVSHGYGMWKSVDAGKTWKQVGLKDSRHILRIRIHPRNPDIVYAAVLGHLFGANEERGIYKSKDGGETWQRILFVNNEIGAADLVMDPVNPRILFASMWRVKRTPYGLSSGGEGSGLWKSTDGGDTWKEITQNKGLPRGTIGIIGVTVSPVNHDRVWAIIEAKNGGVFRSDNGGGKWVKVNDERKLRQRAWYFSKIYADTKDEDKLYVLNVRFWRSKDGGKKFDPIRTPHGDHHDLWISPVNSDMMIIGDDGGAQKTSDGGKSWTTYYNQPTAQFYRVTTDNHFPYRVYGAQQDNSTVRILSRSDGNSITERDWEPTAGGESGWIAPNPENPDIVYGGSYGGYLTRINHKTGERRAINVWPDNPMGYGAKDIKYRFQWNFPILFSPHDPNTLYAAANVLFKTTNEGQSWEAISPDLTRNDTTKLGASGGPITKDNTGVEYYATIFTVAESPDEKGVIWTGSDDGLIYITRDGGKNWENVTPLKSIMPEWIQINSIEINPFEPGGLYVAATMYKWDDFKPYLYKTFNYGKTWKKITNGIDKNHFTRVIRADPERKGLLYAGTESGIYVSFDDGEHWQPFRQNLPVVPVTDLTIKENDLIVATQGRSFWILDDLTPMHQLNKNVLNSDYYLFQPRPAYILSGGSSKASLQNGTNPPNGVAINYYLKEIPDSNSVKLEITDKDGQLIRSFKPKGKKDDVLLKIGKGMNKFVWNMRYEDAEKFDNLILWFGGLRGPKAVPGNYYASLIVKDDTLKTSFKILKDPRSSAAQKDLQAKFDFLIDIRNKLTETHKAIKDIRKIRNSINEVLAKVKDKEENDSIKTFGENIIKKISLIENNLYQTKNRSAQDPLNFPIKLNNRLSSLATMNSIGNYKPTDQSVELKNQLIKMIDKELKKFYLIRDDEIPEFNQLVIDAKIPPVELPGEINSEE